MSTAEQLWPRNSLLEWKDWAITLIPFTHVVYSTGRSRNPPRDTFGGKHCFPGVAENEYSRTALASKFSLGMARLSKYCNSLYTFSILNRGLRDRPVEYTKCVKGIRVFAQSFHSKREFEARAVRLYSFSATTGKQCLPPKVSLGGLRDRPVEYTTCVKGIMYLLNLSSQQRIYCMFAPKSVSRGVTGSSFTTCSIFPLQKRISRPELFGCTHFQQPPESNVCHQKCL